MTESEANQFIAEIPELSQLKEQSPFIKNHVTGIIDEVSGVEIKQSDIKELMDIT